MEGCVSTRGMGNIVFLKSTVTANVYMEVIESPSFIHRESVWRLRHDFSATSGSCTLLTLLHTKKVKTWTQERSIQMLDWQANSPNLNLLEDVWNIMKRRMRSNRPTSLVQLKRLTANTWSSIQVQELESLAASMSKRIAAVIRAKGDLSKGHKILRVIFCCFCCIFYFLLLKKGLKC